MRDERGRFVTGESGNPGGRPRGASLTARLRAMLNEEADKDRDVADLLVDVLVHSALKGDAAAMKLLWSYCEGMPNATMTVEIEEPVLVLTPEEYAALPPGYGGHVIIDDV